MKMKSSNFLHFNKEIGTIHIIGIGGIGMSGIAEILKRLNYQVQGSDIKESDNTRRLGELGIKVFIGHSQENIALANIIVKSSDVLDTNIEIKCGREAGIPIVKRAEFLAEILKTKIPVTISGTHGKTTTTSLIAKMFENAGLDPTVINGGIINTYKSNVRLGSGDYLIVEGDESDATFVKIPSTIAVVTNIDPEHLNYYGGSFENLKDHFFNFLQNIPFYGFGVVCKDHSVTQEVVAKVKDRKIITYSVKDELAHVYAYDIKLNKNESIFSVKIRDYLTGEVTTTIENIVLPIMGIHNVSNSLSAVAIAHELNFSKEQIINSFAGFAGVKLRFTKIAEYNNYEIYDDYAHHPVEIKATLAMAKSVLAENAKIIAIVQPHRYSRLKNLYHDYLDCFSEADVLYVSEVFAAGEEKNPEFTSERLVSELQKTKQNVYYLTGANDLPQIIKDKAQDNDIVLFMGAGDVTYWANNLPQELSKIDAN
jgi:UDP-N-acetylmuramate--alanine ligase